MENQKFKTIRYMNIYNLLQTGTGVETVAMLVLSMQLHGVRWWLPVFTYSLFFTGLLTFLVAIFMQRYAFDLSVINICVLAVTGLAVVYHSHVNPKDRTVSEARNKRILYIALPTIALMLLIAIYGLSSKDSNLFLQRIDRNTKRAVVNQDSILNRVTRLEGKIDKVDSTQKAGDSTSSAYRKKLDKSLGVVGTRLEGVETKVDAQGIKIERNATNIQKNTYELHRQKQ